MGLHIQVGALRKQTLNETLTTWHLEKLGIMDRRVSGLERIVTTKQHVLQQGYHQL